MAIKYKIKPESKLINILFELRDIQADLNAQRRSNLANNALFKCAGLDLRLILKNLKQKP